MQARCFSNRVATAYRVSTATPTKVRTAAVAGQLSDQGPPVCDFPPLSARRRTEVSKKSRGRRASHKCHLPCSALHWRPRVVVQRLHGSFDEWWQPACSHAHSSRALHARYTPATRPLYVCTACVVSVGTRLPHSVGTRLPLWLPLGCHSVGTRFVKNPLTRYRRSVVVSVVISVRYISVLVG